MRNREHSSKWRSFRLGIKRALDIAVATIVLVVAAPFAAVAAIMILMKDGRPVTFSQQRPGLHGEIFTMRKFRTMIIATHAPDGTPLTDSERVTRLGRIMRKTSIDELPQLWNVLKGEMSLVGPRPLLVEYLPKYTPEQMRRHDMRPGITGLAQVSGRQDLKFSERFIIDVQYVDRWSLLLDALILLRTMQRVFRGAGVVTGQSAADFDDLGFLKDNQHYR